MKKNQGQSFVFGSFILMFSNLLVKIIGAVLKIPLTNIVGLGTMAYYNAAYSIYVTFYMISTAGIPVAISRMISTANAKGNKYEVKRIFNVAFTLFFIIGLVGTTVMLAISKSYAKAVELPDAYYAMIVIAPSLFFICLSSAFRGFFQGLTNMVPTAISQVIEAICKMSIGLAAGYILVKRGEPDHIVAAAVIGAVTIGVVAAFVYAAVCKRMYNVLNKDSYETTDNQNIRDVKSILKEMCLVSLPIALSSTIMGLTSNVDTTLITKRLIDTGLLATTAKDFYGAYTSMSVTFFNFAPTLIYPFAIAGVPTLTAYLVKNNKTGAYSTMSSLFRITSIIALPCAFGLCGMGSQILRLVYNDQYISGTDKFLKSVDVAGPALSVLGVAVFFMAMIAATNSVLQAWKRELMPIVSTAVGISVKIISAYILLGIPNFGVLGAAISSMLGYFTIMSFNMFFVIKYTGFVPSIRGVFAKPFISAALCGASAVLCNKFLCSMLGQSKLFTLVAIGAGGVVYFLMLVALKAFNREDVKLMPKGEKICALLEKIHALK